MKAVFTFALVLLAAAAQAQPAAGPPAKIARGDAWGNLGWFSGNKSDVAPDYNSWYNRTLWGGAGASYYWTDHWKTDVEFGAHTAGTVRGHEQLPVPPDAIYPPFVYSEHRDSDRTLSFGQSFQFLRNAWVHPFFGGGIDLTWEQHDVEVPRQVVYSRPPENRPIVLTEGSRGREEQFRPRGFLITGIKAYLSQRGFFRTDLKVGVGERIDNAAIRFGFGVDW